MGSGIEERIRALLSTHLGEDSGTESRRVELSGVTIVELHVERMVVVIDDEPRDKS
ncbi:MAG: hypothetical protein PHI64_22535 [Zoogloea sp.]|uniref:hypothetical protein n=1 Tax=Zoogloea sp. TaxID=49181 RepID=UPI002606C1C5|nr:hypothetical protein [Zoogloea sp.]MDD2991719.1 hypothetical protein [Zoogloea sp.]